MIPFLQSAIISLLLVKIIWFKNIAPVQTLIIKVLDYMLTKYIHNEFLYVAIGKVVCNVVKCLA